MDGYRVERRRLGLALLAVACVVPGTLFFMAAVGRLLQPVEHQPARTLEAIFEAYVGLPAGILAALVVVGPLVALVLGLYLVTAEWRTDPTLRQDAGVLATAAVRLVRRPAFAVGAAVSLVAGLVTIVLMVHAIAG